MKSTQILLSNGWLESNSKHEEGKPGLLEKIRNSSFWVKFWNWEYWPFNLVYAPVFLLHLWQSLKARSFFYFSASNPGLENAGFIGERKSEIMKKIPNHLQPDWFLVENQSFTEIQNTFSQKSLSFPIICKPNIGERGQGVTLIREESEWMDYHTKIGVAYLVQAFVPHPLEFGVFYYRIPGEKNGTVSSIVQKGFLKVEGNGFQTLSELVNVNPRARFVENYLKKKFSNIWDEILPKGKKLELEGIGNHCRGTTFLNANHLITNALVQSFDQISQGIDGFYFGRYDIRVSSLEDLESGKIQILELNGAGAEPGHIYQPGFSFWEGQKVLWQHWKVLFKISEKNHLSGKPYWTYEEAKEIRKAHRKALQTIGM
jgi:hypothetical protein